MQAGTRFTYPGGMEGWVDLVDLIAPQPGLEPATFRSRVQRSTNATTKTTVLAGIHYSDDSALLQDPDVAFIWDPAFNRSFTVLCVFLSSSSFLFAALLRIKVIYISNQSIILGYHISLNQSITISTWPTCSRTCESGHLKARKLLHSMFVFLTFSPVRYFRVAGGLVQLA